MYAIGDKHGIMHAHTYPADSTLLYSPLLNSTQLNSILLYSTLLYSTVIAGFKA